MIRVTIEISEAERANPANHLSCQVYDLSGRHIVGAKFDGGVDENSIPYSNLMFGGDFGSIDEVNITIQSVRLIDYNRIVESI